jgi:hypothetical protein
VHLDDARDQRQADAEAGRRQRCLRLREQAEDRVRHVRRAISTPSSAMRTTACRLMPVIQP